MINVPNAKLPTIVSHAQILTISNLLNACSHVMLVFILMESHVSWNAQVIPSQLDPLMNAQLVSHLALLAQHRQFAYLVLPDIF